MHLKTHATKENAAVHIVRAFPPSQNTDKISMIVHNESPRGRNCSARDRTCVGVGLQGEPPSPRRRDRNVNEVSHEVFSPIRWALVKWGNLPLTPLGELKVEPLEVAVRAPEYA